MKKLFKALFTVALCCAMTSCGKSQRVKDTDKLIKAIGEVNIEKHALIKDAQEAYDKLSYEEKKQVDFITLENAVTKFRYLLNSGKWKNINQHTEYMYLGENGEISITVDGESTLKGKYKFVGDTIDVIITDQNGNEATEKELFKVVQLNGMDHIANSERKDFIKESAYSTSVIQINNQNWQEYFDDEYKFFIDKDSTDVIVSQPRLVERNGYLVLKKEYADRLVSTDKKSSDVIKVYYQEAHEYKKYDWDISKQELVYVKTRLKHDGLMGSVFSNQVLQQDLWRAQSEQGIAQGVFSRHQGSRLKDELYDIAYVFDYKILGVGGTLTLYDKAVYGIDYSTL